MANEVAKRGAGSALENVKAGPLVAAVLGWGEVPTMDTSLIRDEITAAILNAENPEAMLEQANTLSFDQLLGVPIEVQQFYLLPSSYEGDGPPCFAVVKATNLLDGEPLTITTSGENILLVLAKAGDEGWARLRFKVTRAERKTQLGRSPYRVESIPHELPGNGDGK